MNRSRLIGGLAVLILLLMLAAAGVGTAQAEPLALVGAFRLPTWAVIAVAASAGGVWAMAWMSAAPSVDHRRHLVVSAVLTIAAAAAALLLFAAVARESFPAAKAAIAFVLGVLALVAGMRCIDLLGRGESIGIESHWGGLGGGSGGWRLLPATALAILALSFAGGALALVAAESDPAAAIGKGSDPAGQAPANAAEGTAVADEPATGNGVDGNGAAAAPAGNAT